MTDLPGKLFFVLLLYISLCVGSSNRISSLEAVPVVVLSPEVVIPSHVRPDHILFQNEQSSEGLVASVYDPKKFTVTGTISGQVAGLVYNITIQPNDPLVIEDPNHDLELILRHNMNGIHSKFITKCEKLTCVIYYICIEAGNYFINVLIGNDHVIGSPLSITILPGDVEPPRTFAMSIDNEGKGIHPLVRNSDKKSFVSWKWKAANANIFTINPRDMYGNKIGQFEYQHLSFSHNASSSIALQMKSEYLYDGRLMVTANTTVALFLELSILYKGEAILNSPVGIEIEAGDVKPENTLISGTGLIDARVGQPSEVILYLRDKWQNLSPKGFPSATCHSPNCSLAIESHENGTYSILFTPYKRETLELSIRVNGIRIAGSPFTVHVKGNSFPLPPLDWSFLGPFDWKQCLRGATTTEMNIRGSGLCNYGLFIQKELFRLKPFYYPSTLSPQSAVTWRSSRMNATGYSRVLTDGPDFFGWVVGSFHVERDDEYFVYCSGIYEYYIGDITYSGGSWHPLNLQQGNHTIILVVTSRDGQAEYYCEFMPKVEETSWQQDIDPKDVPSWFSFIQLIILYICLRAIVGPMYYTPGEQAN